MSVIKYRPDIDGLRAVAVIPVVLFHLGFSGISGGFLGVDVFFVISGFLITSIILRELNAGTFTFSGFWIRRIRRIFPVLSVMVIATLVACYWLAFRPNLKAYGLDGLSSILSFANITMWQRAGDYWGAQAENSPFLHAWSLSVEEQFYFLFPLLLVVVTKLKHTLLLPLTGLFAALSFVLFYYGIKHHPVASFYLLPMRGWELAAGCILAMVFSKVKESVPARWGNLICVLGLCLILLSYFLVPFGSGLSLLVVMPIIGSVFVIAFGGTDEESVSHRLLSLKPVVYIGKLSYSLYIWHWPIIVLTNKYYLSNGSDSNRTIQLLLILIVTLISYYCIERSTRRMKRILSCSGVLFLVSISIALFFMKGAYQLSYDASEFNDVVYYGESYDVSPVQPNLDRETTLKRFGVVSPHRDSLHDEAFMNGGIIKKYGGENPRVVLFGDSHGLMWAKLIDEICSELQLSVAFNAMTATNPFVQIPPSQNQKALERYTSEQKYFFDVMKLQTVKSWRPGLVIITCRWSQRLKHGINDKIPLIEYIIENGGHVLLIEQPPELFIGNNNTAQYFSYMGLSSGGKVYVSAASEKRHERGFNIVEKLAAKYEGCDYLKISNSLKNEDEDVLVIDGKDVLYYDDDHLSYSGTRRFRDILKQEIKRFSQYESVDR